WDNVFARLKPRVTLAQARAQMNSIQAGLKRAYPGETIEFIRCTCALPRGVRHLRRAGLLRGPATPRNRRPHGAGRAEARHSHASASPRVEADFGWRGDWPCGGLGADANHPKPALWCYAHRSGDFRRGISAVGHGCPARLLAARPSGGKRRSHGSAQVCMTKYEFQMTKEIRRKTQNPNSE